MEIILKEDIIGLGYKNDIVNVKSGYGRNYLIPTGKAVIASESAKKVLAENLKQQAHKLAAIKAEAEKKAEALNNVSLVIAAKVSANRCDLRFCKHQHRCRGTEETGLRYRPQDYNNARHKERRRL